MDQDTLILLLAYGLTWSVLLLIIIKIPGAFRRIWSHILFQVAYTVYCSDIFTSESHSDALANYMLLLFFLAIHFVFILIHFFYLRRKYQEEGTEN